MFFRILFLILFSFEYVAALWPIPRSLQNGTTLLRLADGFDVTLNIDSPPQDLIDAVSRAKALLQNDKLQLLVPDRGESHRSKLGNANGLGKLTLNLRSGAPTIRPIATEATDDLHARDEGYSLIVPADGSDATLIANSSLGLFRGLATFGQLWYDLDGTTYTPMAPVNILNDAPAYPYRGVMLDTSRNLFVIIINTFDCFLRLTPNHSFPVPDLKRLLDAMSWVKISTFHWHVTDSQSWPLGIAEFPELAQKGAYSTQETFTPDDVQDVVTYAAQRGIDVVMEIDNPGHTASIGNSHPEHVACFEGTGDTVGEPPAGQLRLASEATLNFTLEMLTSVASKLPSKFFHTGGDEVNQPCYNEDQQTQQELSSSGRTLEQAIGDWVDATHDRLRSIGKTPVVWEEMVLEHNITLKNDTVALVWISSQHAASIAAKNVRIVHAPADFFYLDCGAGGWLGGDLGNSWCDPFKSWQKAYTFDPLANISTAQHSLVLGGQQLLWAEQSGPENLDPMIWPRAASSAEVFWTGPTLPDGTDRVSAIAGRNKTAKTEVLRRIHDLRARLEVRGIRAINIQPKWCALRPERCTNEQ
ncbi:Glucosamine-6-phosphate isomerase (Glucosamine-6-phosphate deaminase) (GNPDA) (GlcN6P deaminase) [Marasmius crinis-equi]|uniref:Beta-hexosaminidase n=1 Tax=Marasmius crinis-equi TaxID=585013 RepID=A0ABR3FHA3_9AGAR